MKKKKWITPIIKHLVPTKWHWVVSYPEYLGIGKNVDIGAFTYIQAEYGVYLYDNVQIGSHCSIYSKSTIDNKQGRVRILDNAKIGTHSTIMPGITIGKNSIIGAYSFVNMNIPDNVIAYGIPVKIRRKIK